MAVTRSRAAERPQFTRAAIAPFSWRTNELLWSTVAAILIAFGLFLVYRAKSAPLDEIDSDLTQKKLVNLNELTAREDLLPALSIIQDQRARQEIARNIYYLSGGLPNVGHIRQFVTGEQFRLLKPLFVVRRPEQFRRAFLLWSAVFLAAFFLVHMFWSLRRFEGDQTFLPAVLLLTGIGLILMISLRDPVRDQLLFVDFAEGVGIGALILALASMVDYERHFSKLSYVPLLASFFLSVLLIMFGHGPGTSDAKVNLFGFQPVEIIRLLLIFFLAGYFAQRWDVLRHARERRPSLEKLTSKLDIPPVEYTLPVLVSVALALVFFFLQKDMGPALVFLSLFLVLYAVARGSALAPTVGLILLVAGFAVGHWIGVPHTVSERVSMWLSPWDNLVHGGDQLAHSLWAYASGGPTGIGLGLGEPQMVPAAHTDLVLSALGEEWGFIGVAAVFALFGFIIYRACRIALRARSDYEFFLGIGLAAATALQLILIAGGSLGVIPLSGVVTPFMSYGRTSMLANFATIGILVAISAKHGDTERLAVFRTPVLAAGIVLAAAGTLVMAKAGYVQVLRDDRVVGEGALVMQADGARRYQYNPRLMAVMQEIPKGTIYDRNGIPLASSSLDDLQKFKAQYQQLGIDLDRCCPRTDNRYYPFGPLMFDLIGDLRTRMRWGASNTAFVERDQARRLRGYDDRPTVVQVKTGDHIDRVIRYDYRELVPLLRHRYQPNHPAVRRILDRPRDVHMTIDARLQVKLSQILANQLKQAKQDKGAAVVMDPTTGDLLAAVSYPLPPAQNPNSPPPPLTDDEPNPYLDRARFGLYPPGSTFKVVTAIAALRKDPALLHRTYQCIELPDGRVGNYIKGSNRPIRDDIKDKTPHGTVDMERGLVVSCNAYFAQLGTYDVGAQQLSETAKLLGINASSPNTPEQLRKSLSQASYGQGQAVASPFQMARVAATVANGGVMPVGRWISDETNTRTNPPAEVLPGPQSQLLAKLMREVVTGGTGRAAAGPIAVAGKTGTAELANDPSHAWFIGFAPYGGAGKKIAFSVLVENGIYGGTAAAPAGLDITNAAAALGLIGGAAKQ